MVVLGHPPLVAQRRVPGPTDGDAVASRERRAAPRGVQAERSIVSGTGEHRVAVLPRGQRQRLAIVSGERDVHVEVAPRRVELDRTGCAIGVGGTAFDRARAAGRASLPGRSEDEALDQRAGRGERQRGGERHRLRPTDAQRRRVRVGADLVGAELAAHRAGERAGAGHRRRRRRPGDERGHVERAFQRECERHVVEHAVDRPVGDQGELGEWHGQRGEHGITAIERQLAGDCPAGRGAVVDPHVDTGCRERSAGAKEAGHVPFRQRRLQAADVDVDLAGAIDVVDLQVVQRQAADVETAWRDWRRQSRRRRQVDQHAALTHQEHPAVVDDQRQQPHGATEDRPGQPRRDAAGREERLLAVAGCRESHVGQGDATRQQVVFDGARAQVELPRRRDPR